MFLTFLLNLYLKVYLKVYQWYTFIWHKIFTWIGKVMLIYHIDGDKMKNITWNYYLKYGMEKFKNGMFYAKIYDIRGLNHIAFNGDISHVHRIKADSLENPPKRKNVILLDNDIPIDIDLDVLDKYRTNMLHFEDQGIANLGKILTLIGLKCTHVIIIQMFPFNKKTMKIDEVDIDHLYY